MASSVILKNLENTELKIAHRDGLGAKTIYGDEILDVNNGLMVVASIGDMGLIDSPATGRACMVIPLSGAGGIYVYSGSAWLAKVTW